MHAFIERFCIDARLEPRACHRLTLILEELFTNTAVHGYAGVGGVTEERPVWLSLRRESDGVDVVYEDAAAAHDPFAGAQAPDYSAPEADWKVGGLGIVFVVSLGRDVRYERADGRNRIRFRLETEPAATGRA